jgi:hypothetical protein
MDRIRLSPSASVTRTDAGVILRSDLGTFQLTGPDVGAFLDRMVPLLDGSRDQEALVQALAGYSRPSVMAFLDLLKERGLLEAVPDTAARWRGPEEFFRTWAMAPGDAMARLARARVLIVGLEPWGATAAIELAAAGLGALHVIDAAEAVVASGPWSLLVAAVPPGDSELVERVARFAHRAGIVSLWSHLAGTTAVLGPLVTPGKTACRICATADALNPALAERSRAAPGPRADAMGQLLGHLVAMEALRVISEYTPSDLGGRVLIEDLTTFETCLHALVRIPWCRVCGDG